MKKILLSGLLLTLFCVVSCSGTGTTGGKEISKEEADDLIAKYKEVDLHQITYEQTIKAFAEGPTSAAVSEPTSAGMLQSANYMIDNTVGDSYLLLKATQAQYQGESAKKEDYTIGLMEVLKGDSGYVSTMAQYGLSSSGSFESTTNSGPMSESELNSGMDQYMSIGEASHFSEEMKSQLMTDETIYTLNNGCLSIEINLDKESDFALQVANQIIPGIGFGSAVKKLDTNIKMSFDENGYVTYTNIDLDIEIAIFIAASTSQTDLMKCDASVVLNATYNEPFEKTSRFEAEKAAIDNELNNL